MKTKLTVGGLCLLLAVVLAFFLHRPAQQPGSEAGKEAGTAEFAKQVETDRGQSRKPVFTNGFLPAGPYMEAAKTNSPGEQVPVVDLKYSNPTNWPADPRPEVKAFYQFAAAAKLYRFDPVVTYLKDEEFPHFAKAIGTSTYEAQLDTRSKRIVSMYSYRDRSHSMTDYPGVTDEWASGIGAWNRQQMVDETFRILRDLGYTETLAAVSQGRQSFDPQPWRVKLPGGGETIIYPFAIVKLFDANAQARVTAEYRMGPNGPVGLVDWYSIY